MWYDAQIRTGYYIVLYDQLIEIKGITWSISALGFYYHEYLSMHVIDLDSVSSGTWNKFHTLSQVH
jgi:hypothetical protein